jgi:fluoride exporter
MAESWYVYLLLTISGSALGGMARYALSGWIAQRIGARFPVGTLVVNVTGALLIGAAASLSWNAALPGLPGESVRIFLIFGFLGGYTTVSSFSLQTLALLQEGQTGAAFANVITSYLLCLTAVFGGALLAS